MGAITPQKNSEGIERGRVWWLDDQGSQSIGGDLQVRRLSMCGMCPALTVLPEERVQISGDLSMRYRWPASWEAERARELRLAEERRYQGRSYEGSMRPVGIRSFARCAGCWFDVNGLVDQKRKQKSRPLMTSGPPSLPGPASL